MNKEEMTVHEALVESKTLEKRIAKAIREFEPAAVKEHSANKVAGITIDKFKENARSDNQKINDLINRHFAIKKAVAQYNAETTITVGNETMTVAEALWVNDYGIAEKESLLDHMSRIQSNLQTKVDNANGEALDERAERFAQSAFSGKEKPDPEAIKTVVEDYKTRNALEFVDPLILQDKISSLTDEINEYKSKVDSAIQVANATHTVTIEY